MRVYSVYNIVYMRVCLQERKEFTMMEEIYALVMWPLRVLHTHIYHRNIYLHAVYYYYMLFDPDRTRSISKSIMSTMYKLNANAWRFMSDSVYLMMIRMCPKNTKSAFHHIWVPKHTHSILAFAFCDQHISFWNWV